MDLIVQTTTQSHSHRLVKYYQQRDEFPIFPSGPFADSAEELGPPSSHTKGPCLVLFRNMQLSPQQFNSWFKGSFIERPCCRVYWLQRSIPAEPDRQSLFKAIIAADLPDGLTAVRLDVYPRAQELQLGDELFAAGYTAPMQPAAYSHVLFIVQVPGIEQWRWSYMDRQQLWRHSSTQPARFSKSVATAINKIAEALQVLGLTHQAAADNHSSATHPASVGSQHQHDQHDDQQQQQQAAVQQPARWAIDVGACPGGWTSYLADSCGYNVIAVDPAELHPDVLARPGVHHIKARAADAVQEMDRLLQGGQVDLLVCDANDHVACMHQFLGPVLCKLKPGGWLVVTLKFHGRGQKSDDFAAQMAGMLPELEPGKVMWLFANTLCERTYVARKK